VLKLLKKIQKENYPMFKPAVSSGFQIAALTILKVIAALGLKIHAEPAGT
jgi:DNA-binding phage protein